jgi:MOSC domain-containing protein YiiM
MEQMRIVSVNIGKAKSMNYRDKTLTTGIDKKPAGQSVFVGRNGLQGDVICDETVHGGVDQAVYAYGADDYAWWCTELGQEIAPGTFGDNLTIAGLPTNMNAGERLLIGDLVLEATAPRIPCAKFAAQMQDGHFGLKFRRAERPGTYFRVLNEGDVAAGDAATFISNPDGDVSMLELFRLVFDNSPDVVDMQRMLEAPISVRMREKIQKKLNSPTREAEQNSI